MDSGIATGTSLALVAPSRTLRGAPEIGYGIAFSRRGHGFASEAARLVTLACHAAGHAQIWATRRPTNIASVRTVQANGYILIRIHLVGR
ncbi:MAG: GNAT family N-acetyltransferase [Streptosporangiales bacterium]|nr:GNAT family N-acetyltransferase [Streptosporangiales bacterium]